MPTTDLPATLTPREESILSTLAYAQTDPEAGEEEAGSVLLDDRPIGRLSRRPVADADPRGRNGSSPATGSVWYADAVGWLPRIDRPWDTRITRTAPTRRRAAEDLLRAYRNR